MQVFRLLFLIVLVTSHCGCLVFGPGLAEPKVSYALDRDPRRITEWTLTRTAIKDVADGVQSLRYVGGMYPEKAEAAASGFLAVYDKLGGEWPAIAEADRINARWWMRERLESDAKDRLSEPFRRVQERIGPAGPQPSAAVRSEND
jgi:hypothetical protein